jgi:hypothetical protein
MPEFKKCNYRFHNVEKLYVNPFAKETFTPNEVCVSCLASIATVLASQVS